MTWSRSRVAWVAALVALFGLLRGLRRLVEPDERPAALAVAVVVVVAAALLPPALGRPTPEQAGQRKALQLLGAAGVTAVAAYLGSGVLAAGAFGLVAAAVVPVVWPLPKG